MLDDKIKISPLTMTTSKRIGSASLNETSLTPEMEGTDCQTAGAYVDRNKDLQMLMLKMRRIIKDK